MIQRMDNVLIVVEDLEAAKAFFADAVLIRPFIAELAHAETAPL